MRCIECEEIELARVRDERPGQTLPIPYQALEGFPAGRSPSDLTRRRLLQWGVAGFASVYAAKELGFEQVWETVAAAADAPQDRCLVVLYLAGGNDGLNVLIPTEAGIGKDYAAYVAARPQLHRAEGPTPKNLDGNPTARIGSHRLPGPGGAALAFSGVTVSKSGGGDNWAKRFNFTTGGEAFGFDTLYGDGTGAGSDLAIMPAVDAKQYNLSHFDNSDIWFRASNDVNIKTGWLGRWLERYGSDTNPLQAISIDTALSKSIRTSAKPVCAIPSLPMGGFTMNSQNYGGSNGFNVNPQVRSLSQVGALPDNAYLLRSRSTYNLAVATYEQAGSKVYEPGSGYPNNSTLSNRLRTAAHLLAANLGTRIITIHWGSFDTHTGQLAGQDRQLAELSRALGAFKADLTARGIEQNVCTLVFSEFGRRVRENGEGDTAGTDHGAGGLMMAMGSAVRGGFAADWPGCETAERVPANDNQGNLKVPTDYRSVYKAVIEEWFEGDPEAVIGGPAIDTLVRGDGLPGRRLFK